MICPRCGFPGHMPCKLCGQTDFITYELNRFTKASPGRLEFTVILSRRDLDLQNLGLTEAGCDYAQTDEYFPRIFCFFSQKNIARFSTFLGSVQHIKSKSLLINGRWRPYSQELWLPLLEMVTH
jgi:hypothetical protein